MGYAVKCDPGGEDLCSHGCELLILDLAGRVDGSPKATGSILRLVPASSLLGSSQMPPASRAFGGLGFG